MLQTIETELVSLSFDRSAAKVYELLRAAHSIKGCAASLGLEDIVDLAHQVENFFRTLNHPELPFDRNLEKLLFQMYDCLNQLVTYQIEGKTVPLEFHTKIQIVLASLDEEIGHFAIVGQQSPTDLSLGTDLVRSIFEIDVAQSLQRLERILTDDPANNSIAVGEFRAQSEVFIGISQLIDLPNFGALAQATITALDRHPRRSREICCFALVDFYAALEAILTGDRAACGKISPGFAFLLAEAPSDVVPAAPLSPQVELNHLVGGSAGFDSLAVAISSGDAATISQRIGFVNDLIVDDTLLFDLEQMFDRSFELLPVLMLVGGAFRNENRLECGAIAVGSSLNFDLVEMFDLPSHRIPQVLESGNNLSLQFDLLEMFDLCGDRHLHILERDTDSSFDFDLVEIFDLPSITNNLFAAVNDVSSSLNFDLVDIFDIAITEANKECVQRTEINRIVANIASNFELFPQATPDIFAAPPKRVKPARVKKSRQTSTPTPQLSVRVAIDRLDRMNNLLGELAIERHGLSISHEQVNDTLAKLSAQCEGFQTISDRLRIIADNTSILTPQLSTTDRASTPLANDLSPHFDTLELDRYSELHGIVQATIEQLAQIEEQIEDLTLFNTDSGHQIERQQQLLSYLRDDLMWARMLPLSEILNRFPRTLHDLSIEHHKPVDLKITGAGVLVDRATIDKLLDPLLHLLRNAFDHGIDTPAERKAAGKPERGSIEIIAYHQGSQTVIEFRDDGRGIDLDIIKSKAISQGLLKLADADRVTKEQLFDTIFMPGFSTAEKISKLSGRGIGLDIVKAQIQAVKGNISIHSQLGRGTTFTLRIPLTLTIAQLMVCQVGNAIYAFPADSIYRIIVPKLDQIELQEERLFFQLHDTLVAIYNLNDLLPYSNPIPERTLSPTLKSTIDNPSDWLKPLLIVKTGDRLIALEIDRLIAEQELTIVPFGKGINPPSYSYGCTILGDGSLLPVLDIHALIRVTIDRPHCILQPISPSPSPVNTSPPILVVDDSITTRQSLCLSLEKFGYRTLQAKDGQEALQILRQKAGEIELVVCDVEMPNLNGFEFLNIRRQDPTISHIPVVMLTSRSNDKHRQFAAHLGAIDYFIKPYIERDFMAAISELLNRTL